MVKTLKSLSVTEEELNAAKKSFEVDMAEQLLNPGSIVEAMGAHTLTGGEAATTSPIDIAKMVSLADVTVCFV